MARKPQELCAIPSSERSSYAGERSHLYALTVTSMCPQWRILRTEAGVYLTEFFGDILSVDGIESFDPTCGMQEITGLEILQNIESGSVMDFSVGEKIRIGEDAMILLGAGEIPF